VAHDHVRTRHHSDKVQQSVAGPVPRGVVQLPETVDIEKARVSVQPVLRARSISRAPHRDRSGCRRGCEHGVEQPVEAGRGEADRAVGGSVVEAYIAGGLVVDETAGEDDVGDVA
jgi:hypothetical protein